MFTIKITWKKYGEPEKSAEFEAASFKQAAKKELDFFDDMNNYEVIERLIIEKK